MDIKIYVAATKKSKQFDFIFNDPIREYYVASVTDNCEDSIGDKDQYSEVTCLYYIWKHTKNEVVGLEQYRKYFLTPDSINYGAAYKINLIDKQTIEKILDKYDIVVSDWIHNRGFVRVHNSPNHFCKDSRVFDNTLYDNMYDFAMHIRDNYDAKFADYCMNGWMHDLATPAIHNMFIAKRWVVDKYCEWLFPVLKSYEKSMIDNGKHSEDRYLGRAAENVFGYWLEYNNIKTFATRRLEFNYDMTLSPPCCQNTVENIYNINKTTLLRNQ